MTVRENGSNLVTGVNCIPVGGGPTTGTSLSPEGNLNMGCAFVGSDGVYEFGFTRFGASANDNVVTNPDRQGPPQLFMGMSINGQSYPINARGRLIINTFDTATHSASGTIDITLESLNNRNINGSWSVVWQ